MVIGLKRAGWSIRQIAADTHLGASTVHRLWRRWLEQRNVAIYRNVGATRVTSARVDRRILRQAVAAPQATCTAILQHVQDTLDHSISTRTISRRSVANGLHSCRPLRRLPLTPPNRRQRLEWCRARSTWMTEWHRVVFSDESCFCLSSDSRRVRVWRRRGERSNPAAIVERPTVRQRGIMVWGAIAYDSRSPLLRIQGTMTAKRYVDDVLRPVTLPYLQGVPNALYQQDNARPHTARISQQALQDVQMLPWPPYSPDLSPIEHVWDIIGRRWHALAQPRSEDELWQMVERESLRTPSGYGGAASVLMLESAAKASASMLGTASNYRQSQTFTKVCLDHGAMINESCTPIPHSMRSDVDLHAASPVAQNKQGRGQDLGRGFCPISIIQSPKPSNFAASKQLRILQCNINGLCSTATKIKLEEIMEIAEKQKIQIIALQETKLNEKYNLKFKNYNILRKDRNKEGGGLAFLIKNLYYEDIAINIPNTSDLEAQGIKVYLSQNKTIDIFNMYHPPNNKLIEDGTMAQFLTDNTIIEGDLNAKHQLWGCSMPNPRGKILSNIFDDNAFMCLNDGNPTHHSYSYNTAQALDISFSSPDIFHKCKWQILKSNSYQISSKIKFEIKDKKVEKKARKIIHDCKNFTSTHNIFHEKINMKELDYALENTDLNKTPGPDGIHGQMISNLGKNGKEILLDIFNNSWKTGKLPQDWKTATIIPIKKLDKSADDPKNYRPISLTSICCKLMEKIILRRLIYHLDTRNLLPEEQYGFRKGHGTIDQLLFFTQKRMPGHRKRRQFKQTDAFTRGMVIGLKRAGWSIRQIAADTHLGASTVHRLWRRWLEQGNVAIYRNVGATRVTSARVDRRILRQAVAAPKATCTAILQHVQDTLDHSISTRTISRRLVANGLHSCRPLRRLPLTPPNRRQRLEWCRARSTWMTEWHRVVFSDESRFCLSSDSRRVRVWRRRGERSNPAAIVERPTVRQRGIMVWGAIAYDSRSPLLRIQGTMTAQRYVDDVLRPVTLPYLQGVPNALYQQDNARPHTARISQQALQDVQMLPWPPYSPDLSPIEHVWDIIGRRLHALPQPRSEDELWQMVEREWRAIPQDGIRTLIDSLPRRVAACIAVR
ncbi:hypothetical protein LAZ67_15002837, partial [Cordylochernes scorpioides]